MQKKKPEPGVQGNPRLRVPAGGGGRAKKGGGNRNVPRQPPRSEEGQDPLREKGQKRHLGGGGGTMQGEEGNYSLKGS